MDQRINGNRLKIARCFNGYSLTELASMTHISKQSISLYENNNSNPDYEKVRALSNALNFPMNYFFQDDRIKVHTDSTYFRSQLSTTKRDRISQTIKLEFIAQLYEILWEYISFPAYNDPCVNYYDVLDADRNIYFDTDEEIENASRVVREKWDLGDRPIGDFQYILQQNGIIVTGTRVNTDEIDAFSQRTVVDDEDVFFIAVSLGEKTTKCRLRFDLAHELGHIVLHPWSEDVDSISKDEFKARELQANKFAGAFLLPRNSFLKDVLQHPTDLGYYRYLKSKWNVSIKAMIVRSNQLGVITYNQYQYMFRQVSKKGWRLSEPDDVRGTMNESIFQEAVDLLFREKIFTQESLMNRFNERGICLYPSVIEELLNLKKGTLEYRERIMPLLSIKDSNS